MYTQCPYCQTTFRINTAQLNVAEGFVRCSHCQNIFRADKHLSKEMPKQKIMQKPVAADQLTVEEDSEVPDLLKQDIYVPERKSWLGLVFWLLILAILIATLLGQYVWWRDKDSILQNATLRPWLERFCHAFLCTLPPTQNLQEFYMIEHTAQVRTTEDNQSVIRFQALLQNRAFYPQPYPDLLLRFKTDEGNIMAQRQFTPVEYLKLEQLSSEQQLSPGSTVHARLEIASMPNMQQVIEKDKVINYEFDFL